ncbi:MAG: diacylglycerol kinase family protein [Marivibrio sp.]|uniref:diacylglycerol/lipid kinase family protein n=1 Tax=Marivibrio sp. TaxID=2039719 RepID=UPI0032EF28F4
MTPCPANRRRVAVIYNPAAGARQRGRLRGLLKRLKAAGHEILLRRTEGPGDATRIAGALDPASVDVVLAAGGDGTINEVANGLIGRSLPLAIAPLGTANVLAWELGHGLGVRRAATTVAWGDVVRIRPARAGTRGFLLMASAGLDARVVAGVDSALKRRIGKAAYALAAVREIFRATPAPIEVEIDGVPERAALVVATHAAHYAGPFIIARDARLADDRLTVVLLKDGRKRSLILCGLALLLNRIPRLQSAEVRRARSVVFAGPVGEPVQSDGDLIGRTPLSVGVGEAELSLIVADPARVASVRPTESKESAALDRHSPFNS